MRFAFALLAILFLPSSAASAVPPPDPWRLRGEIQAFVTADSLALPAPGAVVFYGSSSIRMWHDRLAADFAPARVVGRGFGGSTMSEAALHVERLVSPLRPSVLVLYEGDNDIEMGRTPGDVVRDFDLLVAKLSARVPRVQIVVLSIKPSPARWAKWPAMQQANAELATICRRHSERMTFVDVGRPLLDGRGQPRPEMYLPDGLHLTAPAYDAWRATLRPVITEVLRRLPVTGTSRQVTPEAP
jgi:lysophospholipase L1-like esterase